MTARALIRITATIGAVAALAAAAVPVAGAGPVGDRRSPDTIDAAAVEAHADDALLDRRSPDAIEAAALVRPTAVRDLRSPDTRETLGAPPVALTSLSAGVRSGFAWGDAGIGALITAVLIGCAGGFALLLTRTQRRQRVQAS